jgi:hypothetical protein
MSTNLNQELHEFRIAMPSREPEFTKFSPELFGGKVDEFE